MNQFELEFINDLKRLGLRRLDVANKLGYSYDTLKRKLQYPGRFTVTDIQKLKELNFKLSKLKL